MWAGKIPGPKPRAANPCDCCPARNGLTPDPPRRGLHGGLRGFCRATRSRNHPGTTPNAPHRESAKCHHAAIHPAGVEQVSPGCKPRDTGAGKGPNPERVQLPRDAGRNHPGIHPERRAFPGLQSARNAITPQSTPQGWNRPARGANPGKQAQNRIGTLKGFNCRATRAGTIPGSTPNAAHFPDCCSARNAITPQSTPQGWDRSARGANPGKPGAGKNRNPERVQLPRDAKRNHPGIHPERPAPREMSSRRNPPRRGGTGQPGCNPRETAQNRIGTLKGFNCRATRAGTIPGSTPNAPHRSDCSPREMSSRRNPPRRGGTGQPGVQTPGNRRRKRPEP